ASHPERARCTVVCLSTREGALEPDVRAVAAEIVKIGFVGSSWRSLPAAIRLVRTLRAKRPDVVYAFMFWGYVLALPLAAISARGATRVAALRSAPDVDLPHRRGLLPLRRLAFGLAHGVITNADTDVWITSYPELAKKLVYVPNGV